MVAIVVEIVADSGSDQADESIVVDGIADGSFIALSFEDATMKDDDGHYRDGNEQYIKILIVRCPCSSSVARQPVGQKLENIAWKFIIKNFINIYK